MNDTAAAIRTVGDQFEQQFRQRRESRAQAIADTASRIESHFVDWAAQLRRQLDEQLATWDQVGIPPSFVTVAGQSHLEKPLNRLLGWLADPDAAHGVGIEFLKHLATLVELSEMVADLQNCDRPDVMCEQSPDDDDSGKEPDLLVRTNNAALLLEKKLWSPESGPQYEPYLELLNRWGGNRTRRAVLCVRRQREVPKGWDLTILHDDLARILDALSRQADVPMWGGSPQRCAPHRLKIGT
jgi:hypothetical protein